MMTTLRTSIRTAAIVGIGIAIARAARRRATTQGPSESASDDRRSPRHTPRVHRVPPAPISHDLDFDGGATAQPMGNDPGWAPGPADHVGSAPIDRTGLGDSASARVYGRGTGDAGVLYGEAGIATGDIDEDGVPAIQRFDGGDGATWMEALRSSTTEHGPRGGTSLDRVAKAMAVAPSDAIEGAAADGLYEDYVVDNLAPELPPAPDGEKPVADKGSGGPSGL
jgi:hypothetical protein